MPNHRKNNMTPAQIVQELDKYIIGQLEAKKKLAIAFRNRWRRQHVNDPIMRKEIKGDNIMMIGNTGSGKTECARRLASIDDGVPFVKVEATKYTERGYIGGDVEGMVRTLVDRAYNIVKQARATEVKEKATKRVEEIILDILIPPLTNEKAKELDTQENNLNAQTRLHFLEKIRKGTLDHREIEIDIEQDTSASIGFMGHGMIDESAMVNLQNMMKKMLPKNIKKRKVTLAQAKEILLEQEKNKLIDLEEVKEEALHKAQVEGIIFIDEIDKIASTVPKSSGPDVSREGVQRDLLSIVEGSTVSTKYGSVSTEHILFITAGAFHQSKPSDLMPEFQGRFPIRVNLDQLNEIDFFYILQKPQNSLTKQYQALFDAEGVKLSFQEDAVQEIAHQAFTINQNIENIGARRLHTVMSHLLNDFLFDTPDKIQQGASIEITKELVIKRVNKLAQEKDTSQYIL